MGETIHGSGAEPKVTLVGMSGLHNRFPDHFYRRNNLFSTYLGGGTLPTEPVRTRTITGRDQPARSRSRLRLPLACRDLLVFLLAELAPSERDRWAQLVSSAHRLPRPPGGEPRDALGNLLLQIGPDDCRRYLRELRGRRSRGAPLLRPEV